MEPWLESLIRMRHNNTAEQKVQQKQWVPIGEIIHVSHCPDCGDVTTIIKKGRFGNKTLPRGHDCPGPITAYQAKQVIRKHAPWKLQAYIGETETGKKIPLYDNPVDLRRVAFKALHKGFRPPGGWRKHGDKWKRG